MIDLCNRNHSNFWVTVPHRTINRALTNEPSDYALRLCILVKTGVDMRETDLTPLLPKLSAISAKDFLKAGGVKTSEPLKPNLKLYVEYSNETWNGAFEHFCYYAHVGQAGNGGAWGAIEFTGQPLAEAHKYRALVEWANSTPPKQP